MESFDVLVVGGGIAGAAAAYELSSRARVAVLERESQPGYHSTGRSAAMYIETYGTPVIRRLVKAARRFLETPPEGFAEGSFLAPRGELMIAREDQVEQLRAAFEAGQRFCDELEMIEGAEARRLIPALRPEAAAAAVYEPGARDIDVAGLHQGFLKGLKARGGVLVCSAEVGALARRDGLWVAETRAGRYAAPVVVNAAGAWADELAALAGLEPLGLVPKRRSAFTFDPPAGTEIARWPLVVDVEESFYFKPDAGRLLGSPADATPSPACDAAPEELDIAHGVARIEAATTLSITRLAHRWAGLRSFFADGDPAVGFDPAAEGFCWLAGQGGYGVKTSSPLGRVCAAEVLGEGFPADLAAAGLSRADLAPERLKETGTEPQQEAQA